MDGVLVTNPGQAQFGIVPGSVSSRTCARRARRRPSPSDFEAYAIGGLSVGEPPDVMYEMVGRTTPLAPDAIGLDI